MDDYKSNNGRNQADSGGGRMNGLEALSMLKYGKKEKPYVEIIEQELATLHFIRSIWLTPKISEKQTVEMITELLFSGKRWMKNEG